MYQPTNNRIVVVVMKATKLKKMDFIGSCGKETDIWYTYILLDVLAWSVAVYFYELCYSPQGKSKYKQQVKCTAILHTETSYKRFIIQLNLFQPFSE